MWKDEDRCAVCFQVLSCGTQPAISSREGDLLICRGCFTGRCLQCEEAPLPTLEEVGGVFYEDHSPYPLCVHCYQAQRQRVRRLLLRYQMRTTADDMLAEYPWPLFPRLPCDKTNVT